MQIFQLFFNKKQSALKHLVSVNIFIYYYNFHTWKLIKPTGVDLNLQFPAGWEKAREIKYSQGYTSPAPRDFVGFGPLTEPEALAVYNFTLSHNFRLILAYHSQGEVIYWQFQDYNPPRSLEIGQRFSYVSGYLLEETPFNSSFAGFKDWFIQSYNRPGYTVEVGLGTNPLPISQFDKIYADNLGILTLGSILAQYFNLFSPILIVFKLFYTYQIKNI